MSFRMIGNLDPHHIDPIIQILQNFSKAFVGASRARRNFEADRNVFDCAEKRPSSGAGIASPCVDSHNAGDDPAGVILGTPAYEP